MRAVLFAVVVPLFFEGVGLALAPVPKAPLPGPDPDLDPKFAAKIKLPEVVGAKALNNALKDKIYLCVNEKGQVILVPADCFLDPAENVTTTLDYPIQVETFLKRRAKEDRIAAGDANSGGLLRSVVILRVHKACPFDKTYGVFKAARRAGYTKFQWRVTTGRDGEGQISFSVGETAKKAEVAFVARAECDDSGIKLANITLRGDGIEELDFKADVDVFAKKLADLAAKNKSQRLALQLEIGEKLLQDDVIKLIDASVRAGFTDVWPVPIDKKNR